MCTCLVFSFTDSKNLNEYIAELLKFNQNYDAELLERALERATQLHEGQKRKSGEPYIIHPRAVGKILAEIGMDDHTIVAGILHDVVEDTVFTVEDVSKEFGADIAYMVDGVTKLTNLVYSSKEEAQAENIRKMFLAMSKDIRVLVIKLCDRLHNMRTINYMSPAKIEEKCKETLEVYAPIAARLGMYKFKFELEDIAFMNLYPSEYRKIDDAMKKISENSSDDVENLIDEINMTLSDLNIKYDIYGRTKHYYSIYKKMIVQHKDIHEIFDLTAIRVVVDTVQDCYAVLGAIHTKWTPIPGRFKDYVAMPKSNRYQSIHTTVLSQSGMPFEIQIRTWEMHQIAEYGIAAHWKYKEGINPDSETEEVKLSWIRQTLEWQKDINDSKEFFETLKVDLFSGQVFVFTPKGDVMELPKGATPLDFAYKIHTKVGEKCVGARVNGRMVPITYQLQNGEIVNIVTSNNAKGPNIDWLKIVKTASARNKIRAFLKKENQVAGSARGKDMIEKACEKKGFDAEKLLTDKHLDRAARKLEFPSVNDLYSALSAGGSLISKTILLCLSFVREEEQSALKQKERAERKLQDRINKPKTITRGVSVKGVDNLLVRFAKCCNPVPGDEIIGYTTKGRGVSVHRADCINMITLPDEDAGRVIEVQWQLDEKNLFFDAGLTIIADDRKGLFGDISKVCEDMDINLTSVNAASDNTGLSTIHIVLSINNTSDIEKCMARLRQLKDVIEVYR